MSKKKYDVVCRECGSNDVVCEGPVYWSIALQTFESPDIYDKGHYCNACDGEAKVDFIEIEEKAA